MALNLTALPYGLRDNKRENGYTMPLHCHLNI